ncbi:putative glycosyltransferase [Carnobacterium divergens]|nr:putative glycosyltransferase [Carnobacterium divergens]
MMDDIGIIIINWNGAADTIECLKSIKKKETCNYKIFLLDNGSKKESIFEIEKWLNQSEDYQSLILTKEEFELRTDFSQYDLIFIKHPQNLGFSMGNNFVLKKIYLQFKQCLLLNNDTVVTKNAITNMVNYLKKNKEVGVVSCNIRYYADHHKLWNAGGKFTWYGDRKYISQKKIDLAITEGDVVIETPFVTGCVMLIKQSVFEEIGFLTEKFFFGEEDFNYCKLLENKRIKVVTLLDSTVYHKISSSIGKATAGKEMIMRKNILHFTNRIINQKYFYSKAYWMVWKRLYIQVIMLKFFKQTKDYQLTKFVGKKIKSYSQAYNGVDYELFKEINNLKFEQ